MQRCTSAGDAGPCSLPQHPSAAPLAHSVSKLSQTVRMSRPRPDRGIRWDAAGSSWLWRQWAVAAVAAAQVATLQVATMALPPPALADSSNFTLDVRPSPGRELEEEYFQTVPQGLNSGDSPPKGPRLGSLLEGPKGKEIQQCTRKCVPTCIRGGQGAPGLGPMSVRKELVVFKEGYRTRAYCLSECIQVCSLTLNPQPPATVPK